MIGLCQFLSIGMLMVRLEVIFVLHAFQLSPTVLGMHAGSTLPTVTEVPHREWHDEPIPGSTPVLAPSLTPATHEVITTSVVEDPADLTLTTEQEDDGNETVLSSQQESETNASTNATASDIVDDTAGPKVREHIGEAIPPVVGKKCSRDGPYPHRPGLKVCYRYFVHRCSKKRGMIRTRKLCNLPCRIRGLTVLHGQRICRRTPESNAPCPANSIMSADRPGKTCQHVLCFECSNAKWRPWVKRYKR